MVEEGMLWPVANSQAAVQQATTCTIHYAPRHLAKIQEKYSQGLPRVRNGTRVDDAPHGRRLHPTEAGLGRIIRPRGEDLFKHPRQAIPWEACREQVPAADGDRACTPPQGCFGAHCRVLSRRQALPGAVTPTSSRLLHRRGAEGPGSSAGQPGRTAAVLGLLGSAGDAGVPGQPWGCWCPWAAPRRCWCPWAVPRRAVRSPSSRGGRRPGRAARPQLPAAGERGDGSARRAERIKNPELPVQRSPQPPRNHLLGDN